MVKKHLLIIYHSKTGSNATLARAVFKGAKHEDIDIDVSVRFPVRAIQVVRWSGGSQALRFVRFSGSAGS